MYSFGVTCAPYAPGRPLRRRGSPMPEVVYVGLDVHRKSVVANVKNREGRVLHKARLSGRGEDLTAYLMALPGEKHVVLEACVVWEHLHRAALRATPHVVLANPKRTRLIAEATLKTDAVDAAALSELIRLNAVPLAYAADEETLRLRALTRDRLYYRELETSVKNHTYAVLLRKGIEYPDGILGKKRIRETLRGLFPEVDRGIDALLDLERRCKALDAAVHEAFLTNHEAQLLYSIPGVGELTALTLVAELCPITRFSNIEKVASYCGLVPTVSQSGERSYYGRMKKTDANIRLKTLLVEAAWTHRRHAEKNSPVKRIARRVAKRAGSTKAAGAAAHKLLRIVYAVLRRGTPYIPEQTSHVDFAAKPPGAVA